MLFILTLLLAVSGNYNTYDSIEVVQKYAGTYEVRLYFWSYCYDDGSHMQKKQHTCTSFTGSSLLNKCLNGYGFKAEKGSTTIGGTSWYCEIYNLHPKPTRSFAQTPNMTIMPTPIETPQTTPEKTLPKQTLKIILEESISKDFNLLIIIIPSCTLLLILIVITVVIIICKRRKTESASETSSSTSTQILPIAQIANNEVQTTVTISSQDQTDPFQQDFENSSSVYLY